MIKTRKRESKEKRTLISQSSPRSESKPPRKREQSKQERRESQTTRIESRSYPIHVKTNKQTIKKKPLKSLLLFPNRLKSTQILAKGDCGTHFW